MGYVMELLNSHEGATTREQFKPGLRLIKPYTAWTSRQWAFSAEDICPWNGIQNTPSAVDVLSNHLVRLTKRVLRQPRRVANG